MSDLVACRRCLRRAWLLARLSGRIDLVGRRPGGVAELLELDDRTLMAAVGSGGDRALLVAYRAFDEQVARAALAGSGMTACCPHGHGYPVLLAGAPGAPGALGILAEPGRWTALLEQPTVAIVGARRASEYGLGAAHALGRGLAAAGVTVVSGMALGIDAAAHAGALERGGTIAVLAGGADVPSPAAHRALHRRIAEAGAVVSELPPGAHPRRFGFPLRNRIIAGLAQMTIVVEAGWSSGALGSARAALALGRDVGAVPGRVSSPLAAGPNALIADGAALVRDARDVLDVVCGPSGAGERLAAASDRGQAAPVPVHLGHLFAALAEGHDTPGRLEGAGFSMSAVLSGLGELELLGLVRRGVGGRWVPATQSGP